MKLTQLKNAYKNLQLILFKKKYLIPSKPIKPLGPYLEFQKKYSQQLKKQVSQSKQKTTLKNKIIKKLIQSNDPKYVKVKQQYQAKYKQYKQKTQKYNELYIVPTLFQGKYRPYNQYVSKQLQLAKQSNEKMSFKEIAQKWKLLSVQEKQKINQQNEKLKQKNIHIYNKFMQNHRVPFPIKYSAYSLYLFDKLNKQHDQIGQTQLNQNLSNLQQIVKQDNKPALSNQKYKHVSQIIQVSMKYKQQYQKLNVEQKQIYIQNARKKTQNRRKIYLQFLNKWNLTQKQMKYIANICKQYEAALSKKKLIKSIQNKQQQEQQVHQEQDLPNIQK